MLKDHFWSPGQLLEITALKSNQGVVYTRIFCGGHLGKRAPLGCYCACSIEIMIFVTAALVI